MSMITALRNVNKTSLASAFGVQNCTTAAMQERLTKCYDRYFRKTPKQNADECLNLPYLIVNKLTQAMFADAKINGKSDLSEKYAEIIQDKATEIMNNVLVGGATILKPYWENNTIKILCIPRENYIPCARDYDGNLSEVILTDTTTIGNKYYTLAEKRKQTNNGCNIQYKLFCSEILGNIGKEISLSVLYPNLKREMTLSIQGLGLKEIKSPFTNDVDFSGDGVPVFEPALELIDAINENEAELRSEFKLGQSRIIVADDMFRRTAAGNLELTDKIFTAVEGDTEDVGITIFSPQFREQSYLARKNAYLRGIEDIIGLQRGLLSDVQTQEKTATEIGQSAATYNLTLIGLQSSFERDIKQFFDVYIDFCILYHCLKAKNADDFLVFDWGDGILYDRTKNFNELLNLVAAGIIKPEILIGWYFGIDISHPVGMQQAKDYMPSMQQLLNNVSDE